MNSFTLRGIFLSVTIFVFSFLFASPALADPGSPHGVTQEVDGYVVELALKAEPVKSGSNGVIVRLEGAEHQPVQNTEVTVTLVSHSDAEDAADKPKTDSHANDEDDHADEPKVYKLKAGHEPGEYEGKVSFASAGEWEVHISFTTGGHEKEVIFPVEVEPGGGPWLLLGSFFSANTAIIITAAVMRRKSALERAAGQL